MTQSGGIALEYGSVSSSASGSDSLLGCRGSMIPSLGMVYPKTRLTQGRSIKITIKEVIPTKVGPPSKEILNI